MKKHPCGTVFFGARRRLVIDRGTKGKAGNSRKMMHNKFTGEVHPETLKQHWFFSKLASMAAMVKLKSNARIN